MSLQRPLIRPQAANAALEHAQGQYCIFLDDDDIFAPGHIDKLVHALQSQAGVHAAHTDTQVVNPQGQEVLRYDRPYQSQRLIFTNIFPIHSVLFARSLVALQGCRFDEALPVLEDWDFWLQVSTHTSFVHVPGCSAIYRYNDRSQLQSDAQHAHHHLQWREHVMQKWLSQLPPQRIAAAGAWFAQQLDHQEQHRAYAEDQLLQREHTLQQTQQELGQSQQDLACNQHQLQHTQQALQQSQTTLQAIYASRGWRWLSWLRRMKKRLSRGGN